MPAVHSSTGSCTSNESCVQAPGTVVPSLSSSISLSSLGDVDIFPVHTSNTWLRNKIVNKTESIVDVFVLKYNLEKETSEHRTLLKQ